VYVAITLVAVVMPAAFLTAAPPPDPSAYVVAGLGMALAVAAMIGLRLETTVDTDEIRVRLVPFPTRVIPLAEVETAEPRTYRPVWEYGGWGLKYGVSSGRAYNARGNRGVQLVLTGGRRVLIGSQRADELADAIRAALPAPV
jgi:hypothetical protein